MSLSTIPKNPIVLGSTNFVDRLYGGGEFEFFQNEKRIEGMLSDTNNLKNYSKIRFHSFTTSGSLTTQGDTLLSLVNANAPAGADVTIRIDNKSEVIIPAGVFPVNEATILVSGGEIRSVGSPHAVTPI